MQPIIRGIQAVGAVDIWYKYNGGRLSDSSNQIRLMNATGSGENAKMENTLDGVKDGAEGIDTSKGIQIAGFRLDGEFLRASPQIASSAVIPILGGGGVALTNNNRTGSISFNCAKVSVPSTGKNQSEETKNDDGTTTKTYSPGVGAMMSGEGVGPVDTSIKVYDMVFIAQLQMSQSGGDSMGATICVNFKFNGVLTKVQFEGCTVASVDPLALSGNDAASYNVVFNYLNWRTSVGESQSGFMTAE